MEDVTGLFFFPESFTQNTITERNDIMKHTFELTGFEDIRKRLADCANTASGKRAAAELAPYRKESELRRSLRETTQARLCLEELGTPPVPLMENLEDIIDRAVRGEMLSAEEAEAVGSFLTAVNRMKSYLEKGKAKQISLAFHCDNLTACGELADEISAAIRGGKVDDYASGALRDIRRDLELKTQEIRDRTERLLRSYKSFLTDAYVVTRNGRICLPVRKDCRGKLPGNVVDTSSTGATLFIEPSSVAGIREELEILRVEEESEVHRILYLLSDHIALEEKALKENIRILGRLDFAFAKGKLSIDLQAVEPAINTENDLCLSGARHPMLPPDTCVPLDLTLTDGTRGMIITGPNTGGKTVAIRTAALFCLMAGAGLHVPCESASIPMRNRVYCDIGDGQDIADNLSTFSAHIRNVLSILENATAESLVVLDEPGSGTDPAEGMGIAIAILEQLRSCGCLFLATTHYPEAGEYTARCPGLVNARMAFDRESLKPLYRLETGKTGESCALYIAKRLGLPRKMLENAALAAYGSITPQLARELGLAMNQAGNAPGTQAYSDADPAEINNFTAKRAPRIEKLEKPAKSTRARYSFQRGDSVVVYPDKKIGIVVRPEDDRGIVLVQIQKEKYRINRKRLKLKVKAEELYPEDYDFSILFDTVENRKARHKMSKGWQKDLTISVEDY